MISSKLSIVAVSLLALSMAGCQSQRFSRLDTPAPEPLAPAPSGSVQTSQLPPPSDAASPNASNPNEFPDVPGEDTQIAALDPDAAAATAPEVTKGSLVGSWTVAASGVDCQMFLTLTKYGDGSRGGTRRCEAPLNDMRSWKLSGKQVLMFDDHGTQIASLYSSGNARFDGQLSNGQPISLTR